ncbi:hypothetical protein NMG29_01125 [Streptomyces cocklensis]|uniref:hypothetical protein n=1 Tax=Actinacidiphila cocklensis TaxID=887465 RepID=UPI00203BE2C2|nr:hypothetical protein [Actinacidiphila cocklensis]MDD1056850.1 hypothetical protein [Actinacidiphila cocklensis]WSX77996.1 hypothetical protein OH826_31615 [Streptomyces sp. NBC_00899]
MQRGYPSPPIRRPSRGRGAGPVRGSDRDRPARLRLALALPGALLATALALDAAAGSLTMPRALLWTGLAAALFAVLLPPRITAGGGRLAVRTLLRTRRVRIDHLVGARLVGGTDRRLVLRDDAGGRVEVDAAAVAESPFLRHELDAGARRSHTAGLLADPSAVCGPAAAADTAQARALFRASGLE